MKRMIIWFDESLVDYEERGGLLLNPDNIVEKVNLAHEYVVLFPSVEGTPKNEARLRSLLPKFNECENVCDIENLPELSGVEVRVADDAEEVRDCFAYFRESEDIGNLAFCETFPVYEYWDGSNFKEIWFNDSTMTACEIIIDEYKNLDTWDGSNFNFRGRFNHGILHRVIEVDGQKPGNDEEYLLEQYTQYQGDIPRAKFLSPTEAKKLLEAS